MSRSLSGDTTSCPVPGTKRPCLRGLRSTTPTTADGRSKFRKVTPFEPPPPNHGAPPAALQLIGNAAPKVELACIAFGEALDTFQHLVRIDRGGRGYGSARLALDADELSVVKLGDVPHGEAVVAEQTRERAAAEVGAVLVDEVPDAQIAQRVSGVGDLEEYDRARLGVEAVADAANERDRMLNMLQHVRARQQITRIARVLGTVEVANERRIARRRRGIAVRRVASVEPIAAIVAGLAEERQEVAAAAADVDDVFPRMP